ncbi:MAG: hypothetical protein ACTH31_03440 [Pseudoclavibacter sp.]
MPATRGLDPAGFGTAVPIRVPRVGGADAGSHQVEDATGSLTTLLQHPTESRAKG